MKLKKRILSLLLCGAMLVSLGPQSVLAEENGQAGGVQQTQGACANTTRSITRTAATRRERREHPAAMNTPQIAMRK